MGKRALIVVDMQNDFLTGTLALSGCPAKQDGVTLVPVINKLIKECKWDLVVYTFDWHPNEHISFVTNAHKFKKHPDSQVTDIAEVRDKVIFDINGSRREQVVWPPHCIQGSDGAKLQKDIIVAENAVNILKGQNVEVDSYSAFYDNDKLNETELQQVMKQHNIDETFICGVATDVCVNFTAIDSNQIGFKTNVILDAIAGVAEESIKSTIENWQQIGVNLTTSHKMLKLWKRGIYNGTWF